MTTYKYTTPENLVVSKIDDDGISRSSCSIENEQYLAWLAEGNTPEPADLVPVFIPSVSPRQIRQALTATGLRDQVEYAVSQGTQDLKDWYEYSTEFERDNAQVTAMGQALGVSDAQLDDLWALAATL